MPVNKKPVHYTTWKKRCDEAELENARLNNVIDDYRSRVLSCSLKVVNVAQVNASSGYVFGESH